MPDIFRKWTSGDPINGLSSEFLNVLVEVAKDYLRRKKSGFTDIVGDEFGKELFVKNSSGSFLAQFSVVGIGTEIIIPSGADTSFFKDSVFETTAPSSTTPYAITTTIANDGEYVKARLSGWTFCKVNVTDAGHGYANATTAYTRLTSGATGTARIVWKESGTGEKWALVCLLGASTSSSGITSINSETGPAITFAAGSSGTDFAVSAATNTVTYNLPAASATASGKVTTGTQTFAGAKTFTSAVTCTAGTGGSFLNTGGTVSATDGTANSMYFGPGGGIGDLVHTLSAGRRLWARLVPNSIGSTEQRGFWIYCDDSGTGTITDAQPSYGIKDYNGSSFVYHLGGWASVNGLEFKGGLYVSGTISGITSLGTVSAGTWNADVIGLAYGGTGANLSDPGADRILFWDDSGSSVAWLGLEPSLTISGTTLGVSEGVAGVGFVSGHLASAQNIASTTFANITGLSFAVSASTTYEAEFFLFVENNSTNGLLLQLTGPSSPTSVHIHIEGAKSSSSDLDTEYLSAFSSPSSILLASAGSGTTFARVKVLLRNGANSGTVQLQAALSSMMGDQDIMIGSHFKACVIE